MKALSMHIQKPKWGIIVYVLTAVSLSKLFFYIVYAKYQIAPLKAVVGVNLPMKAPSMHIQKPY